MVGQLTGNVLNAHIRDAVGLQDALHRLRAGQAARAAHTRIARKRALDLDLRNERDEQRRHNQQQIRGIKAIIITVVHGSRPFWFVLLFYRQSARASTSGADLHNTVFLREYPPTGLARPLFFVILVSNTR